MLSYVNHLYQPLVSPSDCIFSTETMSFIRHIPYIRSPPRPRQSWQSPRSLPLHISAFPL